MVVEDPILKFQDDLRLIILNGKMYYQWIKLLTTSINNFFYKKYFIKSIK
jgi:hypothetical protein